MPNNKPHAVPGSEKDRADGWYPVREHIGDEWRPAFYVARKRYWTIDDGATTFDFPPVEVGPRILLPDEQPAPVEPTILERPSPHPLDDLYRDPQFQREYHEEIRKEQPEPRDSLTGTADDQLWSREEVAAIPGVLRELSAKPAPVERPEELNWCMEVLSGSSESIDRGNSTAWESLLCHALSIAITRHDALEAQVRELQQLSSLKAEHAKEIASITSLLKWAEEDWVEIECGPASGKEGLEITVLRLEPTQGEQRIFRASTILGALRLAHDTPRFQGETVPQFYGRATQEVLEARQEIERLTGELDRAEEALETPYPELKRLAGIAQMPLSTVGSLLRRQAKRDAEPPAKPIAGEPGT